MGVTGALLVLGILVAIGSTATGLAESRPVLAIASALALLLLGAATARGLLTGPSTARWAVLLWWGSVAAFIWAGYHIQVVGPAPNRGRVDQGIQPAGVALILSGLLFCLSIIQGVRAYLAERPSSKTADPR
jgi:predicted MFS family arabinose efflux permease